MTTASDTGWVHLDTLPNVQVSPNYQVDLGVSVRMIPADPAHRTEIDGTVYPFIETNLCVTIPQYRQEQEDAGTATDDYHYAVEEQTVTARTPDDMDYEYTYPSAFDYRTQAEAETERNELAQRAADPSNYLWRPWSE